MRRRTLLPFRLEGGEDLRGHPGREHDHAVVVADHQVARLGRDAGAGHRDAAYPRYVTPAEHGGVDGRVVGGDVQFGQPGTVPWAWVGRGDADTRAEVTWLYVVKGDDGLPALCKLSHYDDRLIREAGRWRFLRREAPTDIG